MLVMVGLFFVLASATERKLLTVDDELFYKGRHWRQLVYADCKLL